MPTVYCAVCLTSWLLQMRQDAEAAEEKDANDGAEAADGAQSPAADAAAAGTAAAGTAAAETAAAGADPASMPEEPATSEDEDAALERLAGTDATGAHSSRPPAAPPCPPPPARPCVRRLTPGPHLQQLSWCVQP